MPVKAASPSGPEPLVRIRGLGKRFGGTVALAGVDLDVHAGSVLALLGPNGAGKSTLIKVLAGVHPADAGQITVDGEPLGSPAASRSMSFIHQDLGLVEWMTVAENIALTNGYARGRGLISWRRTRERCVGALRIVAGHLDPDAPVSGLAPAERSLVAIARALAARARLIVLDEPTARLPAADSARLFGVLHDLRDRGHAILYVTHRLDEVYEVADTFAVLRDGRLVSHGRLAGHSPARLVHDIVGEEDPPTTTRPARPSPATRPAGPSPADDPARPSSADGPAATPAAARSTGTPSADHPATPPTADRPARASDSDRPARPSAADRPAGASAAGHSVSPPAADRPAGTPAADYPARPPAAAHPASPPAVDRPAGTSDGDRSASSPAVDRPVGASAADHPAAPPAAAERPAGTPAAERPARPSAADHPAGTPAADHPVGPPAADHPATPPAAAHPAPPPAAAPPVLALDSVRTPLAGPVSLEVAAGEVLGLVGLSDAGHTDLGRALAGARPLLGGRAVLHGRPYRPRTVAEAVALGVGFVPGDRLREGCLAELTVRENLLANPRAGGRPAPRWIGPRRERADAAALIERFSVRPRDSEAPIATLSGGNQQKVMIGRWLRTELRLLILEEPTASVDIGAKAAIHRLLDEALSAGLAVLLLSTDFEEVASVCGRTLVFVRGSVTAELSGGALTVTGLTRAASAMPPSTPATTP
ncbi:ATP-binding cassette domain-containing protein [Streptomyces coeruleorubidus]|uniref:ATP-binding cassette domain-containing protein n=1 Tax=Streptomyces coeruleorubidus TaxID=116188 RepID=A0ABZ0KQU0_STRC4|nr:ATP-binding cassette domain-containing protein [Streptomyces coeruleorubidus]WOT40452.1 ATP-binding cassette domain-containing protein [Streptomyces coeruleorubidus]